MMRAVSRVGYWEGMSGGSFLGLTREVVLEWVRVRDVPVRLMTMGIMSTCVQSQCERSAFARGVYFRL
jgi:hypothetical protein